MFLGKEAHPHKYSFAKLMPKESVNRPLFLGSFCFVLLRFFQKKPHEKKKKEKFKNKREKHTIKSSFIIIIIIIIFAQKSFFFCSHSHSSFGASGGKRRDGGERSIFFSLRFKIDSRLELKQRGHQKWTRKT
tara:strand:+ start:3829 stop:4224 length:396 start_codon:yes stop_codon:yes gene_type:complete